MNGVASSHFSWGNAYSPSVVATWDKAAVARLTTEIAEAEVTEGTWSGRSFWRLKCAQRGGDSILRSSIASRTELDEGNDVTIPEGIPSPIVNGPSVMASMELVLTSAYDEVSKVLCEGNGSPFVLRKLVCRDRLVVKGTFDDVIKLTEPLGIPAPVLKVIEELWLGSKRDVDDAVSSLLEEEGWDTVWIWSVIDADDAVRIVEGAEDDCWFLMLLTAPEIVVACAVCVPSDPGGVMIVVM
jgi:hypothetical protein